MPLWSPFDGCQNSTLLFYWQQSNFPQFHVPFTITWSEAYVCSLRAAALLLGFLVEQLSFLGTLLSAFLKDVHVYLKLYLLEVLLDWVVKISQHAKIDASKVFKSVESDVRSTREDICSEKSLGSAGLPS